MFQMKAVFKYLYAGARARVLFNFVVVQLACIPLVSCLPDGERDARGVPGVIVHQVDTPSLLKRVLGRAVYTTSPSIAVLPGGDYVISANIFGRGSGADISGTTFIYRSADKGGNWQLLTTLLDMKRGSLFVHEGSLYIWGYTAAPGSIVIRKSEDGGHSWTTPEDGTSGLLREGRFGGTPCNPVVHGERLWIAQGGRRVMSAPADADLLSADSWLLSNAADTASAPFGEKLIVTEAQVAASSGTGVVILPKIGGHPYTVLIRAGAGPAEVIHPATEDWIRIPGGEKKFAAAHDPVSNRFIALSNPVMPAFAESGWPPELIRNTAALLSSDDLKSWSMNHIFLHSDNVDYEAFQYLNFDIDGEDLVIVSRTAFDVGGTRPPRGHDSNLITFHRINDFRRFLD